MQVFSCEFCEISKNTFFTDYLWTTASFFSRFHNFNITPKSCIYKRNLNKFDNDESKEDLNKIDWLTKC